MSATARIARPESSEYASYYHGYISLVDDDVLAALESQRKSTGELLSAIPEEKGNYRYAENKWSIKELVGHVLDCERIFACRALRIARNDKTELPGFDQDTYVSNANYADIPLYEIAGELDLLRRSTLAMFRHFPEEAWTRSGTANKFEVTVRAIAFITAGHEKHHIGILKSRYGC